MKDIWSYLTSPGRSMILYTARLAPLLAAGWIAPLALLYLPDISSRKLLLDWRFDVGKFLQEQYWTPTLVGVGFSVLLTFAISVVVVILRRVVRNRFLVALAAGMLALLCGSVALRQLGATATGTLIGGLVLGWTAFLAAIAVQVGRLSSRIYAFATPATVLMAAFVATSSLMTQVSMRESKCEERQSPERERCIVEDEFFRSLREAANTGETSSFDEDFLRSVDVSTERMLDAKLADCARLAPTLRGVCERGIEKARRRALRGEMTKEVEKMLAERNARRAPKP